MRKSSFILRCAAFVLLLAFSQKMGGGLLLHNLFHKSLTTANNHDSTLNYSCTCVDDFLVPLEETDETVFISPIAAAPIFNSFLPVEIAYQSPFHSSLRGPPSVNA